MKRLLFPVLACIALTSLGQQVSIVERSRVHHDADEAAYYPSLSADGSKLLYSSLDGSGLKLLDFTNNSVRLVSSDAGSGIDARWGGDGNVYFVTRSLGDDKLVYRTGKRYDLSTGSTEVLLAPHHGPVLTVSGTRSGGIKAPKRNFTTAEMGTSVSVEGSELIITTNGSTRRFSPVESYAGYLWPTLSPGGDKVAFVAAETGVIVIDLQGNVLSKLGRYEMPAWYDNDYLVVQNATDDGHQFTSSQIVLLKADGSFRHELTTLTSMTMQPTAGGGKIAYSTIDGILYMMRISIKE